MKNENTLKGKVARIVSTIKQNDQKNGFTYYMELLTDLYSNDSDYTIIKSKMDNLIELLQKVNLQGDEEFKKFESLDFEDEIWYMI
jgi:UDP-N-acetylglucosamine 2-epimerase